MSKGSEEPASLEQDLRDANHAWSHAVHELRSARERYAAAPEDGRAAAQGVLLRAEEAVMRAGERLAEVAGKLAAARRGAR